MSDLLCGPCAAAQRRSAGRRLLLAVAVALVAGAPRVAAGEPGAPPPIDAFLAEPAVRAVALSPNGDRVAYLLREERAGRVGILDVGDPAGARRSWLVSPEIEDLHWRGDGHGLFLVAPDRLAHLEDRPGSRPALVARLDAELGQRFAGVVPGLPAAALVAERPDGGPYRLLRVDGSGTSEVVYDSGERFGDVLFDVGGRLAYVQTTEGREVVVRRRIPAGGWREVLRCAVADGCAPLAVDPRDDRLLVRRRGAGGRWGLVAVDPASGASETLHRDPEGLADLERMIADPQSGTPLLAVYDTDRRRSYALAPDLAPHLARLAELLPGGELFLEPRLTAWLVTETAPRLQRPRHYLYDPGSGRLREILAAERRRGVTLDEAGLADKQHMSYRAGDGRLVHGFVSLPPGVDPRTAPLVVWVHGGPWDHVRRRYDPTIQFLASRGYVVFEPNFRGSTGYGYDYLRAARGELAGGRVHRDIRDGVDHLLASGVGDAARLAVAGHSFGGYATLEALAHAPTRFRAGVALAPPIDLVRALGDLDDDVTLPNGLLFKPLIEDLLADFSDPRAVAALRSGSPEARLAATVRPLLIVAGGRDHLVDRTDVEHYALALDELGRDVSLLVDDASGHGFDARLMRRAVLYLMERFLARHLGGTAVTPPPDPRLAAYLEANLRLTGDSLR